ncbi:inositol monophosphatase family protein [Paenibacillus eucommiae]|uniref:Myo-inositol-1(Or 4)-monophosphatase n=1 Tax=Paenibacillus eucommiae TaxID=1355755 RepID=A0ABS4ISM1_9BACL|nr:inositol monophosphatase family protein [Paenibacillus eucommiae]MBP1990564.1 myo-inositol-1(or 4)-monophosphatase [Paenibacillus eucommiae]
MEEKVIQTAKEISIVAVLEAGRFIRGRFDNLDSYEEKDDYGDIVTEVDHLAEQIILNKIKHIFPSHQIRSEEAGDNQLQSDWLWLVDPLDGTNNFAIGFPAFSCSVTLMHRNEPVLAAIYEPMVDRLFVSSLNAGTICNLKPIVMEKNRNFKKATVAWIQGHKVQNEARAVKLRQHIDLNTKRMMRLWAPTLQWCMLAKGDLDGIILYNSEGEDLYSGMLMVKEAGGLVIDYEGRPFTGMSSEPYMIACHPDRKDYFLNLVQEGLN